MTSAYTATNQVPMAALPTTNGITQQFVASAANTGASTFAPDGLTAAPIFGIGGQALQGGEIVANGIVTLVSYVGPLLNGGSLCWVLFESAGGALQVAPATQSQHAIQLGQVTPIKQLGFAKLTTSGNFTTPSNITTATVFKITLVGGGGGGGASAVGQIGGGGGAGAAASFHISGLSPSTAYVVSIGAGGAGSTSTSTSGTIGGTTQVTISSVVYSCSGGAGGVTGAAVQITYPQGTVSSSITALASAFTINQVPGGIGMYEAATSNYAGNAGGSVPPYGSGGQGGYTSTGNASAAVGYGGGGGGGVGGGTGGKGSSGLFIAEWVA